MIKNRMMLVIIYLITAVLLAFVFLVIFSPKRLNVDNNKNDIDKSEYVSSKYNGVYKFNYFEIDNSGYNSYFCSDLIINNGTCKLKDVKSVNEFKAYNIDITSECIESDNKLYLKLNNDETNYICDLNNKNLDCTLISGEGIYEKLEKITFKYYLPYETYTYINSSSYENYFMNKNLSWKMNIEIVENITGETFTSSSGKLAIIYIGNPDGAFGYLDTCNYGFYENELFSYSCNFKKNLDSPYYVYKNMRYALSQVYGEPTLENFNITNHEYNDEKKYEAALKYGFLTINTSWKFENYNINIMWDYKNNKLKLNYVLTGYENYL